jgi:hypothetical protein
MRGSRILAVIVAGSALLVALSAPQIARAEGSGPPDLAPVPDGYACPAGSQSVRSWITEYGPSPFTTTEAMIIEAYGPTMGPRYLDGTCWTDPGLSEDPATAPGGPYYCPGAPDFDPAWIGKGATPYELSGDGMAGTWICEAYLPNIWWDYQTTPPELPTTTTTEPPTTTTTTSEPTTTTTSEPPRTMGDAWTDTGVPLTEALVGLLGFAAVWTWLWRAFRAGVG